MPGSLNFSSGSGYGSVDDFSAGPNKCTTKPARNPMNDDSPPLTCSDDTQQITVQLPCRLVQRIERYARSHDNTITGVVIEALDSYLRGGKAD